MKTTRQGLSHRGALVRIILIHCGTMCKIAGIGFDNHDDFGGFIHCLATRVVG
jgi:hypothetical protein